MKSFMSLSLFFVLSSKSNNSLASFPSFNKFYHSDSMYLSMPSDKNSHFFGQFYQFLQTLFPE